MISPHPAGLMTEQWVCSRDATVRRPRAPAWRREIRPRAWVSASKPGAFESLRPARLWAFDLSAPGEVKPRDVIYRGERGKPIAGLGGYQMFDSLAVEASGNVCVATLISGCISVIAPDGTIVEQVPTGDRVTTNIAFGGPELKTAYITLSGRGELIAMDWARPGLPLNFLNK